MKDKMTLEQFFDKGYKFVDGDIYLSCSGKVMIVGGMSPHMTLMNATIWITNGL